MDIEMNSGPNVPGIKSLDIFHLNTRSIRYKIDYIRDLADDFHIICLTETHLDNGIDSASIQFQGFDPPIRKDRSQNGGGVMIYMSSLIRKHDSEAEINETLTVDESCENFTKTFLRFCKTCIPCSNVLIRPNDKPWFTSVLRYNIRLRNRLRKKAFQTNSEADIQQYKNQRNHVNNMKKHAKDNYNNNLEDTILNTERGNKTFWQVMGRFMGKSEDTVIPPLITSDGNYAFTDIEKASTLNDYFCTISSVDDSNTELPYFENRTNTQIADINISQSEISDILSSHKVNKACGLDGISHRMLKYTCKTTAVPLCKLFNMSLQQHAYPNLWKSTTAMPIFKKGEKSDQKFVIIDRFLW